MYYGFGTKFPGTDRYLTARALRSPFSDSRTDAANFLRIALGVGDFAFLLLSALAVLGFRLWRKVSHIFSYLPLRRKLLFSTVR